MTVSHLVYGMDIVDANINYENVKEGVVCPYDVEHQDFKSLLQTIILGSKAEFVF